MPIATPEVYGEMLDRAKANSYAYPAINVTSSETLNAALCGFAEAESDGIVQLSTGGSEFASGSKVKDMVTGAVAMAEFAHVVAAKYPINVALHTDHCPKDKLDSFVRPLVAISADRVSAGGQPLFQSHMWDGSATELHENLAIAAELLESCGKAKIILEVEIGVVGGEEDGVAHDINEKLYTAPGDYEHTVRALGGGGSGGGGSGGGENGRYMLAATFGNVHGVYKPGNVKLRPEILKQGQEVATEQLGLPAGSKPFDLVFHGGSGSLLEEIHEALGYGVVKMNVDTDAQYAFTRPIAAHMFTHYDGVLKVDGEVGNKKLYDPRSYLKVAEQSMAARVRQACENLRSAGRMLAG
jgi:fructose-bisphosphate aldolase class II